MDTQIIVVFCLCADMLKSLHHYEDKQCQMSDAEVMTTAIVAILYFKGNFALASRYLYEQRYIPNMLSASRFNRRLHRIADLFLTLFLRLGETWKKLNEKSVYVIDSYPIAVCDNYRIQRSKIYHSEDFRGYIASKKKTLFLWSAHSYYGDRTWRTRRILPGAGSFERHQRVGTLQLRFAGRFICHRRQGLQPLRD